MKVLMPGTRKTPIKNILTTLAVPLKMADAIALFGPAKHQ